MNKIRVGMGFSLVHLTWNDPAMGYASQLAPVQILWKVVISVLVMMWYRNYTSQKGPKDKCEVPLRYLFTRSLFLIGQLYSFDMYAMSFSLSVFNRPVMVYLYLFYVYHFVMF
jgi:hypothetical protein